MRIQIVRAEPAQSAVIAELVGELLHEIMTATGSKAFSFNASETESRVRTWLGNGTYTVFLAHAGRNEVMGFLALYESRSLYAEGTFGTIPELYVRPAFRAQGVGGRLLTEARQFGASKGWSRLEVTTPPLPEFEKTLAFYERHQFSISGGRKMKIDLATPSCFSR